MTTFASIGLLAGLLLGQGAAADAGLQAEVRPLVQQLDAPQKSARDEAERRLLGMGPRVLDLLPEPGAEASAESRVRIERIRRKLQQLGADAAAGPSLVTLQGRMTLAAILARLQEQTGNRIIDARGKSAAAVELSVDFQKTPFWSALDAALDLDQNQWSVYPFGADGTAAIRVVARPPGQLPRSGRAALAGPFRIEPVRVLAQRDLRSPGRASLVVTLEAAWEPRLWPIGLVQRLADVRASDELGRPIAVDDPQAAIEALVGRGAVAAELALPLALPNPPAKQIASLKGSLHAILPGKVEKFRFSDLLHAHNAQQRIASATVTLEQVRQAAGEWEFYLRVRFDEAGQALESHRNWILANEAYLEDAAGKPLAFDSLEPTARSQDEAGFCYRVKLDRPPSQMTLVYKTPGSIVTRDYPYQLRAIPLP